MCKLQVCILSVVKVTFAKPYLRKCERYLGACRVPFL